MKEHPILFSGEMVRAILEGRKTQTRRVVKKQPGGCIEDCYPRPDGLFIWLHLPRGAGVGMGNPFSCPYGTPGDRLWVRETFCTGSFYDCFQEDGAICYRATAGNTTESDCAAWRPSIHMPRRASRITLEVTDVRVERVQDISEDDAKAEGVEPNWCGSLEGWDENKHGWINYLQDEDGEQSYTAVESFQTLWDSINAKPSAKWEDNPWVWVIEFRRIENA